MWPRLSLADARAIAHYLGVLAQLLGACMALPLITAVCFAEWGAASRYLLACGLCVTVGALLRLTHTGQPRLTRPQAVAVTGLAWVLLSLLAAAPLWLSGHFGDYLDALFESVSGLTTTGISVAQDLGHLSNADNMWRFSTQLIGGLGFIVVALSLGLFGRRIESGLYSSEAHTERIVPNVVETARFTARVALAIVGAATVAIALLCVACGIEPVRAALHGLWLSVAAFATGGFSPMPDSVGYYRSFPLELVLMMVMLLGSLNFALFLAAWHGRTDQAARDHELRAAALWVCAMTVLFAAAACSGSQHLSDLPVLLRQGLFTIVSTLSTSGFQTLSTTQLMNVLPSGALLVLVLLMAVGGCAGSTAGGIKLHRLGIVVRSLLLTFREALSPASARITVDYEHFGRRRLDAAAVKEAMTVFVLFTVVCGFGALMGVAHGLDGLSAIVDSVAMTCNGGVSSGAIAPGMPMTLEATYILQMLAGRLEFVTFAAIVIQVVVTVVPPAVTRRLGRR